MLSLMLFANDTTLALQAAKSGIDRIVLDIERRGKKQRQSGYHLEINKDKISDLKKKQGLSISTVLRINRLYSKTKVEIEKALTYGVDFFMLPMVMYPSEVEEFVSLVNGRARTIALIETLSGMVNLHDITRIMGLDEIYVGLNDLRLEAGWHFGYRFLSDGLLDFILKDCVKPFGFGGITIIGQGSPLPTTSILKELARFKASTVIIRRAFKRDIVGMSLKTEVDKIKQYYKMCLSRTPQQIEHDRNKVWDEIKCINIELENRTLKG